MIDCLLVGVKGMSCKHIVKKERRFNCRMICAVAGFLLAWAGCACSQQDRDESESKRHRSQVLSRSVSRGMFEVQEALLAEQYDQALVTLNAMLSRDGDLSDYDKAKILEMLTVAHMSLEHYRRAAQAAEQALRLDTLEESSRNQLYQRLFYLYYFLDDYSRAIEYIEKWFGVEPGPDVQSYFTAAQIYALSEDMDNALSFALKGMDVLRNAPERKPREGWYQLLISIYFNTRKYAEAADVLERALSLWPQRTDYYLQLSAAYQELSRGRESLAILSVAYQNSLLNKESELNRLLQLYRYFDYPFNGAAIFSSGLERETITANEKNWQEIANAWMQAREWERTETALQQAAGLSNTGTHWFRLCQIAYQEERWADSQRYCRAALDKGGLEEEQGAVWYLLALGKYYQNETLEAKEVFKRCMDWPATREDCERWYAYLTEVLSERAEESERIRRETMENEERRRKLQKEIEKTSI